MEVLLRYPDIPIQAFSPSSFFDPNGSCALVKTVADLADFPDEEDRPEKDHAWFLLGLIEAIVEDDTLRLWISDDGAPEGVTFRISQANARRCSI